MRLKSIAFILFFLGFCAISNAQTTQTTFSETGKVQATYYSSGEITERVIYFESGAISEIATFKGSLPHGIWNYYDQNGKVLKTSIYYEGEKLGVWKVWSEFKNEFIEINYTQSERLATITQQENRFE